MVVVLFCHVAISSSPWVITESGVLPTVTTPSKSACCCSAAASSLIFRDAYPFGSEFRQLAILAALSSSRADVPVEIIE